MTIARRTDPETIARIRARYVAEPDTKLEAIAIDEGVSTKTVARYVRDLPRREVSKEKQRLAAIDLAALGCDVREIATRLKMPLRSVVHALAPPPVTPEEVRDNAERAAADAVSS